MDPRVKMSLFIILILITIYLFFSRIQFIQHRKAMDTKLIRVLKGNLQTRLFTSNDHSLHNIVFSINELIAKLEQVQIEAKRSEESRKQLLSSISHDIRTPLTSIIGYIDALKDGVAVSEIEKQEYLKILYMKSNNLKHLVDEIFNMAKLDANEFPLKEEELDFSEVTREVLIEFLPELSKHNIELQVLIPESTCPIIADHLSLMRIMSNLMKNAIYYGKDGKIVGVELLETDREYELHIWDKGLVFQSMIYKMCLSECTEANNQETPRLVVVVSGSLFLKRSLREMVGIYGLKALHGNELFLAFLFQNTILLRNS